MRRLPAAAALAAAFVASPAAAAVLRDGWDEREVTRMRASSPHAVELLEKGEALAIAGRLEEADAAFREGRRECSWSALLRRRDCEALSALGRREEAIGACEQAMADARTTTSSRALLRAMVGGPTAPTVHDVGLALVLVSLEKHMSSATATSSAMACDIAESLGDAVMLKQCAEEMELAAPNDPVTLQAQAMLRSQCPTSRFWVGWLAIAGAVAITAGDALRRLATHRGRWAAAAGIIALFAAPRLAHADAPATSPSAAALPAAHQNLSPSEKAAIEDASHNYLSKWPVDDKDPVSSIPNETDRNGDPLQFGYWLQDATLKAARASNRGDHDAAAKFYQALSVAVPDRAVSFVKMCNEYELAGETDNALKACGDALLRDGVSVGDYTRFIRMELEKSGPLSPKEVTALGNILAHMKDDPNGRDVYPEMECEVGTRTSNVTMLRECAAAFAAVAPNDVRTISYQWALATEERKFGAAERLIEQAQAMGLRQDSIDNMKRTTEARQKNYWFRQLLIMMGVVILAVFGATGFREYSRWRKAKALPSVKDPVPDPVA
jgi:tetratricopeptide (TPR) repeat protein